MEAIGAGETVTVSFSRDGANFTQVDQITSATRHRATRTIDLTQFAYSGPFTANASIRFVATGYGQRERHRHNRQPDDHTRPGLNARRRHPQRRSRERHLLVQRRRRQRRHQRSRRHERRLGGPDLDPGSERRRRGRSADHRSGDAASGADDHRAERLRQQYRHAERRSGHQLQPADRSHDFGCPDHHGGRPLHRQQCPDRRRAHQLQRCDLSPAICSARTTTSSAAPIRPTGIPAA